MTGLFGTLKNAGEHQGTVVSASSPVTGKVELHEVVGQAGGGSVMRPKELAIGRRLDNGAPLTGDHENEPADVTMLRGGMPVIPPNAHVALAHPLQSGERFLRRPYNVDDPPAAGEPQIPACCSRHTSVMSMSSSCPSCVVSPRRTR